MKIYIPDYYKNFKCLAGQCKDSCCVGWDIMIDEESYEHYQNVHTPFKKNLQEGIIFEDESWQFRLDHKKRCAFLNDKNLCDIYIELGEEALCEICTQHPRFYNEYEDVRQSGLGMACEEAARLIFEGDGIFVIQESKELTDDQEGGWAQELVNIEMEFLNLLRQRGSSVDERIDQIFDLASYYQERINETGDMMPRPEKEQIKQHHIMKQMCKKDVITQWLVFFENLDYMDENFKELIKNAAKMSEIEMNHNLNEIYRERLMSYFIYRHFMKAYDDDNLLDKIKFAIISLNVIARIDQYCTTQGIVISKREIARRYSKEIEYSQENMEQIFDELLFD